MSSTASNEIPQWLRRALCRRYAFVQLGGFHASELEKGVPRHRRWCWAFAMFATDEFEVLGAWRTDSGTVEHIIADLRNRGVLSVRVVSIAEALDRGAPLSVESWATAPRSAEPRVIEVIGSRPLPGAVVEGVSSAAIRSAQSAAGRIHDSLVRGVRSRAPFPSTEAASEFIAARLQKADRRLYEARRPARPVLARAA